MGRVTGRLFGMNEPTLIQACIKSSLNSKYVFQGRESSRVLQLLNLCFRHLRRSQMILANTLFQCVCYHPEEFQIITSGTDRKVSTPEGKQELRSFWYERKAKCCGGGCRLWTCQCKGWSLLLISVALGMCYVCHLLVPSLPHL